MPGNPADISDALQKVRNSGEFVYSNQDDSSNLLAKLWDKIMDFIYNIRESLAEWLKNLFPEVEVTSPGFAADIVNMITWIIIVIFILILLFVLYKLLMHYRKKETEEVKTLLKIKEGAIDSESWLDLARNYAQNAQYRNACRAVYMSLILYLDEKSIIKYDKAKTNLEYLQTVRGKEDIYNPLKLIVTVFEELWYGKHNGSVQDYDQCLMNYKKVVNG